jgi:hypothetical protein
MTGLTASVNGTITYGIGKYGQSVIIINDVVTSSGSNSISRTFTSSFSIDNGLTVAFWFKPYQIGTGTQTLLQGGGTAGGSTIIFNLQSNGTVLIWFRDSSYHTITSSAITVNTWNHVCISVGSGTVSAYLNGVSQGTTTYTPSGSVFTDFSLGAYGSQKATPSTGEFDDLRVYNTALSAAQVQEIYQSQGVPGRAVQTPAPITIRVPGNQIAIYSTKWINPSYTGAIVRVERASDGTTSDFYVDINGNFTQSSGTSLTSWLGGAQANVTIWYDQSGSGLNAVKDNTTVYGRAPQLVLDPAGSGKYVIYFPNQNSSNVNYYGFTMASQSVASMMCRYYVSSGKTNDPNWQSLLCTVNNNQGVRFNGLNMNTGDGNDFLYPGGFAIHDGTLKTTSPYLTTTTGSWHTMMASRATGSLSMVYIGQCNPTWGSPPGWLIPRSFYGYMTDMVTFSKGSNPATYASYFASHVSSMTGAPLFSQLSASAASSAVGAFSLRAVNGTTAKAVRVVRQSDLAQQDFWADALGNLLTAPVTGQTLANWLGSSTGNVVTFYSQYGSSTATQSTVANQLKVVTPGLPQFSSTGSTTFYPFSGINLGSIDGSYSKAFWVYATSNASQFDNFLSTSTAATGQGIHQFGWAFPAGSNVPYVTCGQNTYTAYLTSYTFPLNTWTHLAMTYSNPSQTLNVYRNGTQIYSNTAWTSSFNAGDGNLATGFRIGRGFGNPCDAQAYDILVFNSALSASDVTTLYNARLY